MKKLRQNGFAMPIVIIVASALIVMVLAIMQSVASMRTYTLRQYYTKLTQEAAEAGSVYASACLEVNGRVQTWGNTSSDYLSPTSDCNGDALGYSSTGYVASYGAIKTRFEIGNVDFSTTGSIQLSPRGIGELRVGGGTTIGQSYTETMKKTITWVSNLQASRSVSGSYRTCAIVSGAVYCWGYNARGQLGNGQSTGGNPENASTADSLTPVKVRQESGVLAGKTVMDIFAAQFHNCALTSEGKMYCWGYNASGQLGNSSTTDSSVPVQVNGALAGKTVTAIGGTGNTSCAIAESKIYCWGDNSSGTVGANTTTSYYTTPTLVAATGAANELSTTYTATDLSTSGSRSRNMCAIVSGKAYCWGPNNAGQIGDGTTTLRRLPRKVVDTGVLSGKTVTAISQEGYPNVGDSAFPHTCAVANGTAYCWGENVAGQLGRAAGNTTDSSTPVAVFATGALSGKTVLDVAAGLRHTCALASNNQVYCWGANSNGVVGDNTTSTRYVPVAVYQEANILLGATVTNIGAGSNRGCAVTSTGKTFCWGNNAQGQIGDGTSAINCPVGNCSYRIKPTESYFLRPKNNEYIY